ncbi:MAG: hypothetical protein NTZ78_14000 [Candidatus Aureabacteria bacterium]|nr:hypothetical protein [Candidatus Auribacterota bacterium]
MKTVLLIVSLWFLAASLSAGTPAPGNRIDLERFTLDGIGLASSSEEVLRALGKPDEEQRISGSEEGKEKRAEEKGGIVEKRPSEKLSDKIIFAYFTKGIRITFEAQEMRIVSIGVFVSPSPPYDAAQGSFAQGIPLQVREVTLLRRHATQVYKDAKGFLALKKDEQSPLREMAVLSFSPEGWLIKITFAWEENLQIDIDRFCVGGICLGSLASRASDVLGPPAAFSEHGGRYISAWDREGVKIDADKRSLKILTIRIDAQFFDGGFLQPLSLTQRKQAFREYLLDRIYIEGASKICAYRAGQPLSAEKVVLTFDEDDRLFSIVFNTSSNVEVNFAQMSSAGVQVGDSAKQVQRLLGVTRKWRETRESIVLGYPGYGIRLTMAKNAPGGCKRPEEKARPVPWGEMGRVKKIEVLTRDCSRLYSTPFTLAETLDSYKKRAAKYIFRQKEDTLYMSRDGRAPDPGVALLLDFERTGWPLSVTYKEFQNIMVDMKAFTVAGIGLGTHADEAYRILGKPEKARELRGQNLSLVEYPQKGIAMVIDSLNRSVCKITIDMERYEGDFAQDLSIDSDADDFEKVLHAQIYKQDEKRFWFTRDGKPPVWEDGLITFGLTGDVEKISFLTLGVKKEGILLDITKELE